MANNFLASLQDLDPKLKGLLLMSWRLMRTWTSNDVPNRAPPLTESVLKAMAGWSIFNEPALFALSLLVGFYGMLRTGELLALPAWQIHMTCASQPADISLGLTKSGKHQGGAESITVTELPMLQLLWAWIDQASHTFLTPKPQILRQLFQECTEGVKLSDWGFRPYSLRRGGNFVCQNGIFGSCAHCGSLGCHKSCKDLSELGASYVGRPKNHNKFTAPFHHVFHNFTCIYMCIYICVCVCICIHIYIYTRLCMCIYIKIFVQFMYITKTCVM